MTEEAIEEQAAPKKAPAPAKKKQLSARQKAEAIRLYGDGESTQVIAKQFGMHRKTFDRLFAQQGVKKGATARETAEKVAAETQAVLITQAAINAERALKTRDQTYLVGDHLRKLVVATIKEARDRGVSLGTVQNDLRAIKEAAMAIKIIREEQFAVLGIRADDKNEDDELPELRIQTLTSDQIEQLKGQSFKQSFGDELAEVDLDEHEGEHDRAD